MKVKELQSWMGVVNQRAYCNPPTLWNTRELAIRALKVPGCFVECGVAAGSQVAVMAKVLEETGDQRKLHAFDSFRGFPKIGPKDSPEFAQHEGKVAHSLTDVQANMLQWGINPQTIEFHQGWFQNTVLGFNEEIALLRLDGDLYESTKVCLEVLYPLLQVGGFCIVDDYALKGCREAVDDYFEFHKLAYPDAQVIEGGGGPVWWQR